MIRKTSFILFLIIINAIKILAQGDFKPGFIVTNINDTIYGLIELQPDAKNALQCNFKTDEKAIIQGFLPEKISAYRFIDGKFYISRDVSLDGKNQRIFLEYLVDGIADLFYLRSSDRDYYFLEKDSTGLVELTKKTIEITKQDRMDVTNSNIITSKVLDEKYKGVMKFFYQDDPSLYKKIDYSRFGNKSLIDITEDYHNHTCKDQKCVVYQKNLKHIFYAGTKLGIRYSYLNFDFSDEYAKNTSFGGGIQLRFAPKFFHYRWNILVDMMYNQVEYNRIYTQIREGGTRYDYNIYLKSDMIRVPILFEYALPVNIITPTLSLGYDNVFLLNSDYSIYSNYYMDTHLHTYCWGILAGTGLKTDIGEKTHLFFQAEYEFQSTFTQLKKSVDIDCWNLHSVYFSIGIDYCLY